MGDNTYNRSRCRYYEYGAWRTNGQRIRYVAPRAGPWPALSSNPWTSPEIAADLQAVRWLTNTTNVGPSLGAKSDYVVISQGTDDGDFGAVDWPCLSCGLFWREWRVKTRCASAVDDSYVDECWSLLAKLLHSVSRQCIHVRSIHILQYSYRALRTYDVLVKE